MIRILVAGTDRTSAISDVNLSLGVTKEAATGSFKVDAYGSKWRPSGELEVEIFWDDDAGTRKLFGGYIVEVKRSVDEAHVITYDCTLKNYSHLLDRKNVNRLFEDMSAADIIQAIVDDYAGPGITTSNVDPDAGIAVVSVLFNNIAPSQAIQKLSDLVGFEWYVDEDKDIHFFAKLSETAPFALTDDDAGEDEASHVFSSLEVSEDFTQIRNSILVEGGDELSSVTAADNFKGDGTLHTFTLSRQYSGLALTVGGVSKTVGIQNIDTFATKDALYDFNLHTLYFNPASPPGAGVAIVVTAKYYFPIAIRHRETTSIGLYGEREHFIQDKSLKSRADATARALAELAAYAKSLKDGGFVTHRQGLRPGQKIHISSGDGFDGDFVIQRMRGSLTSPTRMSWKVDVVSVKTFEIIDLLAAIIRNGRIESPANPVVVTAEAVDRTIRVAREIGVAFSGILLEKTMEVSRETRHYFDDPPIWVAGPFAPPDIDDRRRVIFADRGVLLQ